VHLAASVVGEVDGGTGIARWRLEGNGAVVADGQS